MGLGLMIQPNFFICYEILAIAAHFVGILSYIWSSTLGKRSWSTNLFCRLCCFSLYSLLFFGESLYSLLLCEATLAHSIIQCKVLREFCAKLLKTQRGVHQKEKNTKGWITMDNNSTDFVSISVKTKKVLTLSFSFSLKTKISLLFIYLPRYRKKVSPDIVLLFYLVPLSLFPPNFRYQI